MDPRIDPDTATRPAGSHRRVVAALAAFALALGAGGAVAACDDEDNEGPAEEAGQAVDEAGEEAGEAIEDADEEVGEDEK
jgi:hypothetical protein